MMLGRCLQLRRESAKAAKGVQEGDGGRLARECREVKVM